MPLLHRTVRGHVKAAPEKKGGRAFGGRTPASGIPFGRRQQTRTSMSQRQQTVAPQPRLGTGFAESERTWVTRRLTPLAARLRSLPGAGVELDLSVKDRYGTDPRVTLVCTGRNRLVATAAAQKLGAAVTEVRNDIIRQLDGAKTRREPRNTRIRGQR